MKIKDVNKFRQLLQDRDVKKAVEENKVQTDEPYTSELLQKAESYKDALEPTITLRNYNSLREKKLSVLSCAIILLAFVVVFILGYNLYLTACWIVIAVLIVLINIKGLTVYKNKDDLTFEDYKKVCAAHLYVTSLVQPEEVDSKGNIIVEDLTAINIMPSTEESKVTTKSLVEGK